MEHFRLKVFGAVYSLGSYTKAARELGISQPAVSQNISELEKELGVPLFVRGAAVPVADGGGSEGSAANGSADASKGGKMIPTPAAEVFWAMAQGILRDYREIGVMFNPEAASYEVVRIRADRSASEYVLPRVLDFLKSAYPTVRFEVLPPANAGAVTAHAPLEAVEVPSTEVKTTEPADPADVTMTTVPVSQRGSICLRFEVYGPADPFVEAIRLILNYFCL